MVSETSFYPRFRLPIYDVMWHEHTLSRMQTFMALIGLQMLWRLEGYVMLRIFQRHVAETKLNIHEVAG